MIYSYRSLNIRRGPYDKVAAELSNFFKVGDTPVIAYTEKYFALFSDGKQYSQSIDITDEEGGYYLINTIRGVFFVERRNKDFWIMPARTYVDENGVTQYCPDDSNKMKLRKRYRNFISTRNCACVVPYGKRCNKPMGVRPLNAGV